MKPFLLTLFYGFELLVGMVLQALLGWYLWAEVLMDLPTWAWWASGVAGALCVADGLSRFLSNSRRLDFWIFLCLCLFMPVYGSVGCVLLVLYRVWRRDDVHLAEDFVDYVHSEESEDDADGIRFASASAEDIVFQELSIQSYTDIMRGSNTLLKKALIGKILQEWTPNAVSLLQLALKDDVYEIRSYASTALTTIEDRMNRAIQDARRSAQQDPEDSALKLKLARAYLNYAESGLLDHSSSAHYAGIAQDVLGGIVDGIKPGEDLHIELLALQGKAAQLTGDADGQIEAFGSILEHFPDHQETLGHMCNYYFQQRDFITLSEYCKRFLAVTHTEHPLYEPARLWCSNETAETVQ